MQNEVARTLADLSGSPDIRPYAIFEAIQFCSFDRLAVHKV